LATYNVWHNARGVALHILIVSDSHGNTPNLKEAMLLHPEISHVLHCGDGEADVVVFGHTHRRLIERRGSIVLVNPGSIAGRFPARTATYVIPDLQDGAVTAKEYEL
jgi:predicted phosphodiesterase